MADKKLSAILFFHILHRLPKRNNHISLRFGKDKFAERKDVFPMESDWTFRENEKERKRI
jgi:hypothetical protein